MNLFSYIVAYSLGFGFGLLLRRNVAVSPQHLAQLKKMEVQATTLIDDKKQLQQEIAELKRQRDLSTQDNLAILAILKGENR